MFGGRFAQIIADLWSNTQGSEKTVHFSNAEAVSEAEALRGSLEGYTDRANQVLSEYEDQMQRLGSIKDRSQRLQQLLTATETLEELPVSDTLALNVQTLKYLFDESSDWVLRSFRIAGGREAALTYIDGITHRTDLDNLLLKPLLYDAFPIRGDGGTEQIRTLLENHAVALSQLRATGSIREVVDSIMHGDAALLIDGDASGLIVSLRNFPKRDITEPEVESVIRGPREGFVESVRTNTALLRNRLRTPQLKMDNLRVGRLSRTDIVVTYLRGVTPDVLVEEVKRRISRVEIDAIIDSAYVEELIEDDPYSPFPQVTPTERPDVVAANLLEGRVAILVDGSSFALILPTTFWSLMQASEDYYERFYVGSALRILRYVFGLIALVTPSLYIAITTFHQEMLPTPLLLTVAATREGIPFPSVVEALMMEIVFEALREAGVRLPKPVGQAVSIVGALVIGQSAVQAGIVSAPIVIVVALTGIASFTFPRFNLGISIRLLRFPLMLLAGTLGLYGIMIGLLAILVHLAGLRSLGSPYLSPVAPLSAGDLTQVVVRPPVWLRGFRPRLTGYPNPRRQATRVKPGPEPWEGDESRARQERQRGGDSE